MCRFGGPSKIVPNQTIFVVVAQGFHRVACGADTMSRGSQFLGAAT
jgi:hypothetical protein